MKTGIRVDHWVKSRFPTATNRQIEEAIAENLVTDPRGKPLLKGMRLESDESPIPDVARLEQHLGVIRQGFRTVDIKVVYDFDHYAIVDKPAGLKCHPLSLFDTKTVSHWALSQFPTVDTEFPEIQPTVTPHRLDTGTSGLLIVAKTKSAFEMWRDRFSKKQITKKYLAWAWGMPTMAYYANQSPIAHHPKAKSRMVTVKNRYIPPVQEAATEVRVIRVEQNPDRFLCEVTCQTGVTHQVRVHLADLGFPLIGDALYDPEYAQRGLQMPYHQLRAVELNWGGLIFNAPASPDYAVNP